MHKKILSLFFLAVIFFTALSVDFLNITGEMTRELIISFTYQQGRTDPSADSSQVLDSRITQLIADETSSVSSLLPYKDSLIDLNGTVLKLAGNRSFFGQTDNINITSSGYCVGEYPYTSTDYEVEQMVAFKEYLDQKGINLLYVSEPAKYTDDNFFTQEFGGKSYLNQNTDLFLERISQAGIPYLDLRDSIPEGLDPLSMFYRGDHHWTVPTALWAARTVAEKLNSDFGYQIDLSLYDPNQFNSQEFPCSWLGEQARKIGRSYIGLDDFVLMTPNYPTSYTFYGRDGSVTERGDFSSFIQENFYQFTGSYYSGPSFHYSYSIPGRDSLIHNDLADMGNVLILGDSYQAAMTPFLSLGISNVRSFILRDKSTFDVDSARTLVEEGSYDTVIIAYAQFMIGAHDDPTNANYEMFNLG